MWDADLPRSPNMTRFPFPTSLRRKVDTIVFVDPQGKRYHHPKRLSHQMSPGMSGETQQRLLPSTLVFFQSGMSMCIFVLLSCVALTVFVLLLTQSGGNERLPCSGKDAQVA
jgi:hypothetical protein